MRGLLFLHFLGVTLWLGGGFASMALGIASKAESRAALATVARLQWSVLRTLVLPGSLLTVFSGLMLTFRLMNSGRMGSPWMVTMQILGLAGAMLALFVLVPTAARITRVDPAGEHAAWFDRMRLRLRVVGAVSGVMGFIALLAGAWYRYGG